MKVSRAKNAKVASGAQSAQGPSDPDLHEKS